MLLRFLRATVAHFPFITVEQAKGRLDDLGMRDPALMRLREDPIQSASERPEAATRLGYMLCHDCAMGYFLDYSQRFEQHKHLVSKYLYTPIIYHYGIGPQYPLKPTALPRDVHRAYLMHAPRSLLDAAMGGDDNGA